VLEPYVTMRRSYKGCLGGIEYRKVVEKSLTQRQLSLRENEEDMSELRKEPIAQRWVVITQREETGWHERLILETAGFLALAPFASRYPFEVWVIPKDHVPDFAQTEELALFDLAQLMRQLFHATKKVLDEPFYSVALHSTPLQERFQRQYHWHFEIRPRVGHTTGFEWATGVYINPIPPEEAAARLREAINS
jgi:galactose-1-phosphate uridylyltransferase